VIWSSSRRPSLTRSTPPTSITLPISAPPWLVVP